MRFLLFIALIFVLSSCIPGVKFAAKTQTGQPIAVDTLNLLSVMIGPVLEPLIHYIDAETAALIMEAEGDIVNTIRTDLVATLEEKLPCKIRTSKELVAPGVNAYRVNRAVPCENKSFPMVFFGEGDLNFQEFGKMNNISVELKSNQAMRENISNFAQKFNLSNVAICYYRLAVINLDNHEANRYIRLEAYFLVFDRRGSLALQATGILDLSNISGLDVNEFKAELEKYQILNNMMAIPMSQKFLH